MKTALVRRFVALIVLVAIGTSTTYAADRVISPLDVIDVAVDGQPALTAKYSVSADGSVELPLIAKLDRRRYPKGVKVSDEALARVNLTPARFHGEWNYSLSPT